MKLNIGKLIERSGRKAIGSNPKIGARIRAGFERSSNKFPKG